MSYLPKKKIIVPIDFSEHSRRAAEVALELANGAEHLHAVHVLPIINAYEVGLVLPDVNDDTRRRRAEESLRDTFSDKKFAGLKTVVLFGDAGTEIVRYAEVEHADLVVMPSHGYSGLKRLLIGSVAERVLRLAHCSVLILKHLLPTEEAEQPGKNRKS